MMKKTMSIMTLIIVLFNTACNKDETHLFDKAEAYIDTNRDSLIYYLKSIKHPENLAPPQRAKYGLMKTINLPIDKKAEASIDYSLNYYLTAKDSTMIVESYIVKSYYYQDSLSKRIEYLSTAKDMALALNNRIKSASLYLNIGTCYERLDDYDMALISYLKALEYVSFDDYLYCLSYWNLARLYSEKAMGNKAIESLQNLIESAKVHFPQSLSSAYKQLSDIYLDSKDFKKAIEYIDLSIEYKTNIKEVPTYNLAQALIFINTQELDLARQYLGYAIESPNEYVSNRALGYLSELNNSIGQYERAYYARINQEDNFRSLQSAEETRVLEQKYKDEKLKNENNQLKLDKQQQQNYSLVITIILLVVFASVYVIYSYKRKQQVLVKYQHEERLLKEQALLHESQNLLLKRDNELALLHQKSATLRASLFKKMSLSKKLPSLDKDGAKGESEGKINLSEQDLNELRKTVDTAYNDFSIRLFESYPDLLTDDIFLCCLIKIQVDMQDLSDIYCISKAGITKRKMRIKKNKLKIETQMSLDEFIQQF